MPGKTIAASCRGLKSERAIGYNRKPCPICAILGGASQEALVA
jgi:hypothetical protein